MISTTVCPQIIVFYQNFRNRNTKIYQYIFTKCLALFMPSTTLLYCQCKYIPKTACYKSSAQFLKTLLYFRVECLGVTLQMFKGSFTLIHWKTLQSAWEKAIKKTIEYLLSLYEKENSPSLLQTNYSFFKGSPCNCCG